MKTCVENKRKARLKRDIEKKSAEIAQLQRKITESEASQENPVSAKKLPLKDVGEARKIIEYLWSELVDAKSSANINERKEELAVSHDYIIPVACL